MSDIIIIIGQVVIIWSLVDIYNLIKKGKNE
jgi:hypothetical protein